MEGVVVVVVMVMMVVGERGQPARRSRLLICDVQDAGQQRGERGALLGFLWGDTAAVGCCPAAPGSCGVRGHGGNLTSCQQLYMMA